MNKTRLFCIAFVLGLASVARAADVSSTTVQAQIADWSLIQAAGGMQIGPAIQHSSSSWKFSLDCNLGAHASGVIIRRTVVTQENTSIYISFEVARPVWTLTPERGECQPIVIDSDPGLHLVFYRDGAGKTYPLGHVEFNFDSNVLSHPGG